MKPITASFSKYERYRDSGVRWLGDIPEHWKVEKSKWLFTKANRPIQQKDEVVTCFRDGQVTLRKNRRLEGFTNAIKEHGYQGIRKGDLVIHAMDAFAGAIGVSDSNGKSSPVYSACVPRLKGTINAYYYAYYLRDLALSGFIVSLSKGIRERSTDFRFNEFVALLLPYAPLQEQTAIANFLDKKTAQIDKAIAIKEQQIARLKEYQQIIIQKAVTQGLNPNVTMKDSGIEWIGKIPEHWQLYPMKRIAKLSPKINLTNYKSDDLVTFLPMEKVSANGEIICDIKQPIKSVNTGFTPFQKGDVIVAKITPCFENGKSALLNHLETAIGFGSTEFHVLRYYELIIGEFLYYIVSSHTFLKQGEGMMIGSAGQKRVPSSFISSFVVALPNKDEQKQIVNYIETESHKIEQAIALQQAQIEKLKEYKTTLINSTVTGKIKVV